MSERTAVYAKLKAAALFLAAAVCLGGWTSSFFLLLPPVWSGDAHLSPSSAVVIGAEVSPYLLVSASVLLFFRDRLAYQLALAAGLTALPVLVWVEVLLAPWNSWIFLNGPISEFPLTLGIVSPTLIVVATAISSIRLLPERWAFRAVPLCTRTWPALSAAFLVISAWFVHSVIPYSVPAYNHPARFEFRILHIQKRGLHFQETVVYGSRDGKLWVSRQQRRFFQYGFECCAAIASVEQSGSIPDRARALTESPVLGALHTTPAKPLWSWNAEGWYLVLKDSRLLAFTSEHGTTPPREVTALFHDIEKLPAAYESHDVVRDICLGFCYDPVAALGFSVLEQRRQLTQ